MELTKIRIQEDIKGKIVEIAAGLGMDASEIKNDELIPATGLLDSPALLELVSWYEEHFDIELAQDEITIDNLGSIDAMTDFLIARKTA